MKNKIVLAISVIVIVILLIFTIIIMQKKNIEIKIDGEKEIQEQANLDNKNEIQDKEIISQANLDTSVNNSPNEINENQTKESKEEKISIDNNEDLVHQLKCNFKDIITTFYERKNISL